MAFLGHLGPLWLLRPAPFGLIQETKGGNHLAPKPELGPPEPALVINPLDPNLAKSPLDTKMAIEPVGPIFGHGTTMDHYSSHGLWKLPEATRPAQKALPST
ncbi:hypothetical protein O181_111600 [Austropuccinia psidii MF-1]|uniref:Uncharacterized protein n=1 Tax=Austropuccinia psidii MF-1 TaxID=1389203 RepID=A0A9Q3K2Q6_9BASI|nr:hypothetical protein [Austropuccinia psidii MF-1]